VSKRNQGRRPSRESDERHLRDPTGSEERPERQADGPSRFRPDLRFLLVTTAAVSRKDPAAFEDGLLAVVGCAGSLSRPAVFEVVNDTLCEALSRVWAGGWQPAEVARAARRCRSSRHVDLIVTLMAAECGAAGALPPDEWAEQLSSLGAATPWWGSGPDWLEPWVARSRLGWDAALILVVEVLAVLMGLPVIERLSAIPSEWKLYRGRRRRHHRVDDVMLTKVRALLAKAESTSFEAEADAFTAKAQELMARHAIDEAVAQCAAVGSGEKPSVRRIPIDDPYAVLKGSLLNVVARTNNVRCVWTSEYAFMTVIGFETDLDAVELLFTSLLMQASLAMSREDQSTASRGDSRTRSFRQSFYLAFADRIQERLTGATEAARVEAEAQLGRNLLPVLASRLEEVEDATTRLFPRVGRLRGPSATNAAGWHAGLSAADLATLGPDQHGLGSAG
jgi:hypothetical protein